MIVILDVESIVILVEIAIQDVEEIGVIAIGTATATRTCASKRLHPPPRPPFTCLQRMLMSECVYVIVTEAGTVGGIVIASVVEIVEVAIVIAIGRVIAAVTASCMARDADR